MTDQRLSKENVLVCVAGTTPQIVTETLFALRQKGVNVDTIMVITTLAGKAKIDSRLLDNGNGALFCYCRDYGIDPETIDFGEHNIYLIQTVDGQNLDDIRTESDNEAAGNQICSIIAGICNDPNTILHASVAGGRKTMSIYLTAALQLFGRAEDTLSHVLVNEDFEFHPEFSYPPPAPRLLTLKDGREVSTADARVQLAQIPFIKLRGSDIEKRLSEGKSYAELVNLAQDHLDAKEVPKEIYIDLVKGTVASSDYFSKLTPKLFHSYVMFALLKDGADPAAPDGFISIDDIRRRHIVKAYDLIMSARGEEPFPSDPRRLLGTRWGFAAKLLINVTGETYEDVEAYKTRFIEGLSKLNKLMSDAGFPSNYRVKKLVEGRPGKYGIEIPAELINFRGLT